MNKIKRCVLISIVCLLSFNAHAMYPLSQQILRGSKALGIGLAYVVSSPFLFVDYVDGTTERYEMMQEAQRRAEQPEGSSPQMVIENIAPTLGKGPAIIVTVNNNNQQSSTPVPIAAKSTVYDSVIDKAGRVLTWLRRHKLMALTIGATSAYAGLQSYLWYLAHSLLADERWANWKKHCTVKDLYGIAHKDLLKDLADEMKQRLNNDQPLKNIELFVQQASTEIVLLNRYKKLSNIARFRLIKKFFFVSDELLESIGERIQRITFIRSVALAWLTKEQEQPIFA